MDETDKRTLARLLNKLADEPGNADYAYSEPIADVAWLAGLNWSDADGWVVPGDSEHS